MLLVQHSQRWRQFPAVDDLKNVINASKKDMKKFTRKGVHCPWQFRDVVNESA
jgi:hypothetical protein